MVDQIMSGRTVIQVGVITGPTGRHAINDTYPLVEPFVVLNIYTSDVQTATEDTLYSVTYEAWTNMINSTLTWSLHTNATWLTRTVSTIHGTPQNADVGSYWVDISVSDGTNQDAHNFTLNVLNTNDPPEINITDVLSVNETQLYSVDYDAYDMDPTNDILAWDVITNATFLAMDSSTGVLSGTPSRAQLGTYYVNVSVNDGHDGWDDSNFTLTVLNLNDPPQIITEDVLNATETVLYSVDYDAIDIDPTNDTLTWAVGTDAGFLSMDSDSGVLSGTPPKGDLGDYFVNVTVNDGRDGWNYSNFTLTVQNLNDPPGINQSWADFSIDEDTIDESISLNDWFSDIDGDTLTFSYSGQDKFELNILATRHVRLIPEANWSGYEILTFYANDSVFQVEDSVNITVLPVNDAPFGPSIEILVETLTEGQDQSARGNASDVDIAYGDILTYSWSSNVSGPIGESQELNLSLDAGYHMITLNVSDIDGAWVETTLDIEIQPPKDVPVINQSDTDGDNLPDDWETEHFTNLTQDGDDDPDNDKFTNRQEWENGTDPNDSEDYPGKVVDDGDDDDDGEETTFMTDYWWLIPLLFIIIILIILFLLTRKKKEEEELPEEEKELECPECGEFVGAGETVCPSCGTTFEEGAEVEGEEEGGEEEETEDEESDLTEEELFEEEFEEEFEEDLEGSELLEDEEPLSDEELEKELEEELDDEVGEEEGGEGVEEPVEEKEPVPEEPPEEKPEESVEKAQDLEEKKEE
jgi:hypothetical protein